MGQRSLAYYLISAIAAEIWTYFTNVLGIMYSLMPLTYYYIITTPMPAIYAWEKCRCLDSVFLLVFQLISAQKKKKKIKC